MIHLKEKPHFSISKKILFYFSALWIRPKIKVLAGIYHIPYIWPSNLIKILYLINMFKHHSISFENFTCIWNLEYIQWIFIDRFKLKNYWKTVSQRKRGDHFYPILQLFEFDKVSKILNTNNTSNSISFFKLN